MANDIITLDRPPFGTYEEELVNGFPQIEALEEIWVREANPLLTGGYMLLRIYLALRTLDAKSLELCDRIQADYQVRRHYDEVELEWHRLRWFADAVPANLPSRIFKRPPRLWTPEMHRLDLELAPKGVDIQRNGTFRYT